MKSWKFWSLNRLIFLMILIAGFLAVVAQSVVYYQLESKHVRVESYQRLHAIGKRLNALSGYLSDADSLAILNTEIAMMTKMAKLSHIAYTSSTGSVLAATEQSWVGLPVESTSLSALLPMTASNDAFLAGEVNEYDDRKMIKGTFAFTLASVESTHSGAELGLISVGMDLTNPLKEMRGRVIRVALVSGTLVLLVAGLFWIFVNHALTKPLNQLVLTTRRIANGDYTSPSSLPQQNELGEISTALDNLRTTTQARIIAQRNSNRLAAVVENSTNEIYVADASTYQILSANAAARKNLGYSEEEVEALMPWDFVEGMTSDNIHEMIAPLINGDLQTLVFEAAHRRKEGSVYPVEVNLVYVGDQSPPFFTAVVQDKTEKQHQRASIALRNRAIDAMDVGVTITDARKEGHPLVYVNQTLCDLTGYKAAELIGQPAKILQKDNSWQSAHKIIDEAQTKGEPVQVVFESTRRDGSSYADELSLSPVFDDNNQLTHYIGINRDITEKLDIQKRLLQAQKMDAVGQLSSGIAHDFNNLLTVIGGNIEFLAMDIKDEDHREYLNEADNAVQMGARLTRRLLTFAKQRDLEIAVVRVNDLVLSALELLRSSIGETVTLSSNLATDLWSVQADPSEIENTVVNLAINARDAMPKGGRISIYTSNESIEDEGQEFEMEPGDYVKLSIEDNGIGMSDEVKAKIFEPFFTTKEPGKGTGLGLASIYGFAKQSGGHVNVYSELGKGTVINVYLPRFSETSIATDTPKPSSSEPYNSGRILVVEDNELVRKTTLRRLHALGFDTEYTDNGVQALELLKQDSDFDLLFSDVVMEGGVSGYDLAHWIQNNNPHCPVLLTSGFNPEDERTNTADRMPLKMLQKPYSTRDLQQAIDEVLTITQT